MYIECKTGASGDMLMAALFELVGEDDRKRFLDIMNDTGIGEVRVAAEKSVSKGLTGTHMRVTVEGVEELDHHHEHGHSHEHHHEHHHDHHTPTDVARIIDGMKIPDNVKDEAKAVYGIIASAESKVHGEKIEEIHFHEVGTKDAIADVAGVCLLMDMIGADETAVSPVCTGSGYVRCAHGLIPVPAPATVEILKGIPVYAGDVETELCTPTGAALLRHFASSFGPMPEMRIDKTGIGTGTKELPDRPNCVRIFLEEGSKC